MEAKRNSRIFVAAGDFHIPYQSDMAVEVFKKMLSKVRPHVSVILGDILDCYMFGWHPPTWNLPESEFKSDLAQANAVLDYVQSKTRERTIFVAGNHEARIDKWAADRREGRSVYSMVSPRLNLSRNRKRFTYVPFGSADGRYPHYKLNSRIVAVHGWSYAKNAARKHLEMSQGMSVIFGHTHRDEHVKTQKVWQEHGIVQARSAGCMCKRIPLYGVGRPVEWIHAFIIGYMGRDSDTMYTVPLYGNTAILPDGTEIRV